MELYRGRGIKSDIKGWEIHGEKEKDEGCSPWGNNMHRGKNG
jgi:hypothetical protein